MIRIPWACAHSKTCTCLQAAFLRCIIAFWRLERQISWPNLLVKNLWLELKSSNISSMIKIFYTDLDVISGQEHVHTNISCGRADIGAHTIQTARSPSRISTVPGTATEKWALYSALYSRVAWGIHSRHSGNLRNPITNSPLGCSEARMPSAPHRFIFENSIVTSHLLFRLAGGLSYFQISHGLSIQ